jgi:hypothetical protein
MDGRETREGSKGAAMLQIFSQNGVIRCNPLSTAGRCDAQKQPPFPATRVFP